MLNEKIDQDYINAMKARDTVKSSTLNFLRAQLRNVQIEKKTKLLEDPDVAAVIKKQIKQRHDSIEQYQKGGRQDLVDKETAELNILKSYLPQELGEDELHKIIGQAIAESQASSIKDMGKVMKAVAEKVAGRADNKFVSELVKKALTA